MKYCDRCKEEEATHSNVLLQQVGDDYSISNVTKDICNKCYNEIKSRGTDGIRRFNKAQKILDGEEHG